MSKFATHIPVNTLAIRHLLPKGALVHESSYDPASNAVIINWEHGLLHTGYGFSVQITQDQLEKGELPKGVVDLRPGDIAPVESDVESAPAVEMPAGAKRRGRPPKNE